MKAIMPAISRLMTVNTGDELRDARGATLLWLLGSLVVLNIIYGVVVVPAASDFVAAVMMIVAAQCVYMGMFWIARSGRIDAAAFCTGLIISTLILGSIPMFGMLSVYVATLFAPMILVGFCARSFYGWLLFVIQVVTMLVLYVLMPASDDLVLDHLIVTSCTLMMVPVAATLNNRFQRLLVGRLLDMNGILEQARERAEQSNKAKSMFLATMSHELRTPLSTIMGYTDLVCESVEDDAVDGLQVLDDLSQVRYAGVHLLGLIDDVLDLARVESGQMPLEWEAIHVNELLEQLAQEVMPAMEKNGNTFRFECDARLDVLNSDRKRVRQILLNLLSNAAKFTHEGHVVLRAKLAFCVKNECKIVRFDVVDTGIGLAREDHERIFGRFEQADTSTTRKYGGTGLGLSLSSELADALQGWITLESAPDEGSCFSLTLPIMRVEVRNALVS